MSITATEFKKNFGKYLTLAMNEDVIITKNGKAILVLSSIYKEKVATVDALFGSVPSSMTEEEIEEERLKKI